MKSFIQFSFLLISILSFSSCKKETNETTNQTVKNITIKSSEEYVFDTMASGDEEGASIKTQAKHFEKSEIKRDESTNWSPVYYYKPTTGYTGSDYVEIETCTGGSIPCSNKEIIRINFNVTN